VKSARRGGAREALERSQRELADFFDNAPVPLRLVGADGTILRANRAELALLGYAAEDYIGRHIADFHVDRSVIGEMLERLSRGEALCGYKARLRCKDGSIKFVRIDSSAYFEDRRFVHTRCMTRDMTEEQNAEETAVRLATLVECSDDAIVGKTLDGVITSWNRGAERIFGYTADEMIGQPILRLMPPDRVDDFPRILATLQRGERVDHFETERLCKDGRRIQVSITVSPIRDASGNIIGASKIARDVTERKRSEEALARLLASERQARAEAETALRTRDEFLSIVSHELRTPLASILGWVNVLKAGASGDKAAAAVQAIERSGRAQAKLIEDLLDVSRVITGQMRLDLRLVDLPAVLRQAVDTIRPTAGTKGVRLDVHLDETAGPVAGDVDRLQQIAWNLLSNAVKFTPSGGTVELRLQRRAIDVCLTVRDTGRGIPPAFLPYVFERFRQAERADSRRTGGLGLGLAIVRHLTELHGGAVAVASEGEGHGATFTVTLPLTMLAESAGDAAAASRLSGVRVLVIDDDPDTRDALQLVLQGHGAQVTAAGSGAEARACIASAAPDVIISDLRLPGEDGYDLLRAMRAIDRFRSTPAIAITGLDSDDRIEAAESAGYDLRLGKPIDAEALVNAVTDLLTRIRTVGERA
jgi:PAS domain S-box-containing protein